VLSYLLLVLLLFVVLLRFLLCLLSSCDHDSDKLRETLRNLTFPLSTFPRRDQTKAQARANNVGPCGSAFVSSFVFSISSFRNSFCRRRCKRTCNIAFKPLRPCLNKLNFGPGVNNPLNRKS
jgi:hypothetical protein